MNICTECKTEFEQCVWTELNFLKRDANIYFE